MFLHERKSSNTLLEQECPSMLTTHVKEEGRAAMVNHGYTSEITDIYFPFFTYEKMMEHFDVEYDLSTEETALTTYEQAIALAPHQAVLHYHKGQILEQLGRTNEAQVAYETARNLGHQRC
jgi:hypothetical protein